MLVLGTNIAVLLDCSKSSRQCSLPSLLTYYSRVRASIVAAYLQGRYVDRRVFVRAPKYYRKYDERGVELVWHLWARAR